MAARFGSISAPFLGGAPTSPSCQQSSLARPSVAPTLTGPPPPTTEALCGEAWVPDSTAGTLEHLNLLGPLLGSSLLGATLLGNLLALSPLLQNRPLLPSTLPPLGLSLGPGQGPPPGHYQPLGWPAPEPAGELPASTPILPGLEEGGQHPPAQRLPGDPATERAQRQPRG